MALRDFVPQRLRSAGAAIVEKAAVAAVSVRDFWGPIRESFAGAWQKNVVVDHRETVLAFAAVYACVSRIANDIGKLRIKLVEQNADGVWSEVQRTSPYEAVLRKPNHYQNRIQFLVDWMVSKLLYGNTYVLKVRDDRGIVIALYVLDARRVCPMVAPNGDVYYQLGNDNLAGVYNGVTVPSTYIIHDRGPTLFHSLIGVSPIFAAGASATQGNRIQANSARFFENQSRPSGMLTAAGTIDEITAARLKQEWESNFGGHNIGRLAVLGDGLKYEPMTIPADDAQLIEQLKWTVEDVARAFAMPLYKIGAGPVPPTGNVEALNTQYYSDCLQIHIESIELCLDEGLEVDRVKDAVYGTELDLDILMRMDSSTQITMLADAIKGGIMTPNEARARMNLNRVPGGDEVYLQQQNFSLTALAKRDAREDPFSTGSKPALPPAPAPAPAGENPADAESTGPAAEAARAAMALAQQAIADARAEKLRADDAIEQLRAAEAQREQEKQDAAQRAADEACEFFAEITKGLIHDDAT